MFIKGMDVIENIDNMNLSRELEIAKFRNYGKEHFGHLIKNEISLESFINHSTKFFSINLPPQISDYLIRLDTAPYFWISDATIVKKIEELLNIKSSKLNFVANFKEIKKYFLQWAMQKSAKERQYYTVSISTQIERNLSYQSFYNLVIYAVLLTFDKSIYNPKKAIELYDKAIEMVHRCEIDENLINELLYYLNIYKGFVHLVEYNYSKARNVFQEALGYNNNGVNAYYYIALSSRYLDDFDATFEGLKNVLEFDKMRFQYAINYNHLNLFAFFYNSANFYNVFSELGFAQMLPDIDFLLRSLYSMDANSMELTYSKLINLDNLRIKEFFNEAVYSEIEFLKTALDTYKQKRNGLIRIVEQIFRDKLITLIEYIRNLIESHYFDQIKEEISVFDKQIDQNKRQLELIKQEREDAHKKIKITQKENVDYLKETIEERIKFLEDKIAHLDKTHKYDPSQVFFSSMVFTAAISFVIFLVIGLIASITGWDDSSTKLQTFAIHGFKWGGITLLFGIIISIFTGVSSFWEKNSEKKKLLAQLKYIKENESNEKQNLEEDLVIKSRIYEQKFSDRINTQQKILESFIEERELNYKRKYELAKKEIDEYVTPLSELLKSLENAG
jgi:hypothetical protein